MTKLQFRRDTAANWSSANPTLSAGEPAFETDTGKEKIGDGTTAWSSLPYQSSNNLGRFTQGLIGHDERHGLTLVRAAANPNFTVSGQAALAASGAAAPTTSATIYWPWLVKVVGLISSPLDTFYRYRSTDHDNGVGGIWLDTGPTPAGPWTGRGQVYVDTSSGSQSETPSVIWNSDEALFFMYYQQASVSGASGVQSTCLATSPDGVTWTRVGKVIDVYSGWVFPGDGHTGYFRPFRIGGQWFAYHLMGGTNWPHFGTSTSNDGRTWWMDNRPLGYGSDQIPGGRRIEWNSGDVVMWNGRLWWIGILANFASGATPKDARIATAPLAADMRHLVGTPKIQLYPPVGANESVNYRSLHSYVDATGVLWVTYQCDGNFNIATAV